MNDELTHYGILGMKWGVRRYQPYPKGSRRGKFLGKEPKSRTPKNDEEDKSRGLTDKQKTYLKVGAAAVVTGLAVYGGYKLKKHLDLKKPIDMVKDSKADLIKKVNPNFGKTRDMGAYMNCGNCTIAYDLQKRGIDAKAAYNEVGILPSQIGQFYEGLHSNSIKVMEVASDRKENLNNISKQMINAYPEGSSGNVYLPMEGGFNHFISWGIENGKAIFEDPQNPSADVKEYFKNLSTTTPGAKRYGIRMTRLDDLKPITENLKSVVKTGDISNLTDREMYSDFDAFIQKGEGFVMNI